MSLTLISPYLKFCNGIDIISKGYCRNFMIFIFAFISRSIMSSPCQVFLNALRGVWLINFSHWTWIMINSFFRNNLSKIQIFVAFELIFFKFESTDHKNSFWCRWKIIFVQRSKLLICNFKFRFCEWQFLIAKSCIVIRKLIHLTILNLAQLVRTILFRRRANY